MKHGSNFTFESKPSAPTVFYNLQQNDSELRFRCLVKSWTLNTAGKIARNYLNLFEMAAMSCHTNCNKLSYYILKKKERKKNDNYLSNAWEILTVCNKEHVNGRRFICKTRIFIPIQHSISMLVYNSLQY